MPGLTVDTIRGRVIAAATDLLRARPDLQPDRAYPLDSVPGAIFTPHRFPSFTEFRAAEALSDGLTWIRTGEEWSVSEVAPESPAAFQGVQSGDVWTVPEDNPWSLCLRAQPVRLALRRGGQPRPVTLTCQPFEHSQLLGAQLNAETGYLRPSFLPASYGYLWLRLSNEVDRLKALGVKTLVLDLRGNEGGAVDLAMEAADLFLRRGIIVHIQPADSEAGASEAESFEASDGQFDVREPLVVLVDRHTGGAAEVLAAALQQNGRGLLLGQQTAGECRLWTAGTLYGAQRSGDGSREIVGTYRYPDGSWLPPANQSTCGRGLMPDVPLEQDASFRSYLPDPAHDAPLAEAMTLLRASP